MSDTEKSGAALDEPTATTPAAQSGDQCVSLGGDKSASTQHDESTAEQASQPEVQEQPSADFAFGTSRGSGLARGKRKTVSAPDAPTAQTNASGYEPTAIEVITPKSEYSNPFTGETVVETPRQAETPTIESPKAEESALAAAPIPSEEKPSTAESTATSAAPTATKAGPKPELKILPPAQPNRNRQSWESPSEHPAHRAAAAAATGENANNDSVADTPRSRGPRGSSEGRPTFQPERRSRTPRNAEADERSPRPEKQLREERPKREPREPRNPRERTERTERAAASTAKPVAKPQGFFGWLKSLFGGTDSKPGSSRPKTSHGSAPSHEGGPKRRSRGGRGRGNSDAARGNDSFSERRNGEKTVGERPSPSRSSEDQRDRPRNRSRGGRGGRSRNGPRSEGQQSGGAI